MSFFFFFFLSFFSLHQNHNHHLSISSTYADRCVYVSYSINISRRANARVKVSVYIYIHIHIYIHSVEGVGSRLIVDYLCGTCEWIVGFMLLCVIVIKEDKRTEGEEEKKNSFVKGLYVYDKQIFKYKSMRE